MPIECHAHGSGTSTIRYICALYGGGLIPGARIRRRAILMPSSKTYRTRKGARAMFTPQMPVISTPLSVALLLLLIGGLLRENLSWRRNGACEAGPEPPGGLPDP